MEPLIKAPPKPPTDFSRPWQEAPLEHLKAERRKAEIEELFARQNMTAYARQGATIGRLQELADVAHFWKVEKRAIDEVIKRREAEEAQPE